MEIPPALSRSCIEKAAARIVLQSAHQTVLVHPVGEYRGGRALYRVADEAVFQPDAPCSFSRAGGQAIAGCDQSDTVGLQVTEHVVCTAEKVTSIRSVPAEAGAAYREVSFIHRGYPPSTSLHPSWRRAEEDFAS